MKLMVVEMQQQLNELEDRERAEGGGDPKPPPRGREKGEYRVNPFNTGGEVFETPFKIFSESEHCLLQERRKVRKGWREVHVAAGKRIQVEFLQTPTF